MVINELKLHQSVHTTPRLNTQTLKAPTLTIFCSVLQPVVNLFRVRRSSFNPLSDGIQIHAVLMGGGIQCLPLKTLENEATESCEGSKWGFLRVPSTTRPLPGG